MSVTVANLYQAVCYDLLEDGGLALGIVTQQQFLDMLGLVLMDFLQRTGIIWVVYTQRISSGVSNYSIPESNPELFGAYVDGSQLNKKDVFVPAELTYSVDQAGTVSTYHQDQLAIQKVGILPIPNFTGTATAGAYGTFQVGNRNLSLVVSSLASKETWGSGDTLDTIPDSFTPYLVYGILEKIFSMDGESKDIQRAMYCHARYEEGISVGKSIIRNYVSEAEQ